MEGVTGASPLWRIQGGTPEPVLLNPTLGNPLVVQWLRTQCSHCQGPRFNSWSGHLDPAGCIVADCPPPHPIKKTNPTLHRFCFPGVDGLTGGCREHDLVFWPSLHLLSHYSPLLYATFDLDYVSCFFLDLGP